MSRRSWRLFAAAFAVIAAGAALIGEDAQKRKSSPVTDAMIASPSANDWLAWRGTSRSLGYSPLKQINKDNVGQLKVVWRRPMRRGWQEAAPIVHDGVLYLANNGGVVDAYDAATGDPLWTYTPSRGRASPSVVGAASTEASDQGFTSVL